MISMRLPWAFPGAECRAKRISRESDIRLRIMMQTEYQPGDGRSPGTKKTPAAFMLRSTMPQPFVRLFLCFCFLFSAAPLANAIEVKVSAQALERTLQA